MTDARLLLDAPARRWNILRRRARLAVAAAALALSSGADGPYEIALHSTPKAPDAKGDARLVFAQSPFGATVTADGHAAYDVRITASALPAPSSLGAYTTYVAWMVSTDLSTWQPLGAVGNGTTTVGRATMNKFLLVITAEPTAKPARHVGPTVLHGTSPSGWLQNFMTHPLFRGVTG